VRNSGWVGFSSSTLQTMLYSLRTCITSNKPDSSSLFLWTCLFSLPPCHRFCAVWLSRDPMTPVMLLHLDVRWNLGPVDF
jgi:hypothetical protein